MFSQIFGSLRILQQSFWRDEAFSVLIAQKQPLDIISFISKDQSPPLYFLILHYWMMWQGSSEAGVRYLSVLIHLLLGVVVFLIARKLITSFLGQVALTATIVFNPFLIQYAFEARPYGLMALLTALGVYFIAERKYFLASIPLALTILTHNFALFNIAAIGLWWIYIHRTTLFKDIKEGLSLFLLPAITFIGWSAVIWTQLGRVHQGFWIHTTDLSMFADAFSKYSEGDIWYPLQQQMYFFGSVFFIIGISYWIWKTTKEKEFPVLLGFLSSIPFVITYLLSKFFIPLYHNRYLIASVPVLILFIGYSFTKLFQRNRMVKIAVILFIILYIGLEIKTIKQITDIYTKPAINWGVHQALEHAQPGDIIVPQDSLNFLETKFYAQNNVKHIQTYAYAKDGKIPYYIGSVLFEKKDIITHLPAHAHIWRIQPDGGYYLQITK